MECEIQCNEESNRITTLLFPERRKERKKTCRAVRNISQNVSECYEIESMMPHTHTLTHTLININVQTHQIKINVCVCVSAKKRGEKKPKTTGHSFG